MASVIGKEYLRKQVDGTQYVRVPELNSGCTGCVAVVDRPLCDKLAMCNIEGMRSVWIRDTPEGLVEYAIHRLEA